MKRILREAKQLCAGIFWIIPTDESLREYKMLLFDIPCNPDGTSETAGLSIALNSKSGTSYNHKKIWEDEIQRNNTYKSFNRKPYNYYPRGRVEIDRNAATIFLNPHINQPHIIQRIKHDFGLSHHNIAEVKIKVDGSQHYKCFLDD